MGLNTRAKLILFVFLTLEKIFSFKKALFPTDNARMSGLYTTGGI